jgi:hypothetical protein
MVAVFRKYLDGTSASAHSITTSDVGIGDDGKCVHAVTDDRLDFHHCSDLSPVPLEANTPLIGCAIASQVEGAKWAWNHPNFYVQKATCQPAGSFAKL